MDIRTSPIPPGQGARTGNAASHGRELHRTGRGESHAAHRDVRTADELKITPDFVERTLGRAADRVLDRLFETRPAQVNEPPADGRGIERTPEEMASRILDRLGRRLDRAVRKQDHRMERDAHRFMKGVGKALRQAMRETLELLQDTVGAPGGEGVSLESLGKHLLRGVTEMVRSGAGADRVAASASASVDAERTFSLDVTTADGDLVSIHVGSRVSAAASVAVDGDEEGLSLSAGQSLSRTQELRFRVEGELDEGELHAIRDLVGRAENLSNKFYAGNLESALEEAGRLGFDTDELAGFSLDLAQSVESRAAIAYRVVMDLGEGDGERIIDGENPLREAGDFVRMLRDYLEDRDVSVLFRDGTVLALDLLLGALDTHPAPGDDDSGASGRPGDAFLGVLNDLAAVPEIPLDRDAVPAPSEPGRQSL